MRSGFVANILFVVGINLLIKPFYIFGIDRVVQNEVGPSEYGLYFAILNFVYLFQIINDFGVQNFNHSIFSQHQQLIEKYLPKTLGTKLVLAFLFVLLTLACGWLIGYQQIAAKLMLLIIVNQGLASLIMLLRTNLSARGFYAHDSIMSVVDKCFLIFIVGFLLYLRSDTITIEHFVYARTLSFSLSLLVVLIFLKWKLKFSILSFNWDWKFIKWQLKKSYPFALILLLMTLYTRMDAVMIERLLDHGEEEAGIYAASYRILDAANMLGLLFAGLLLPMFAKILDQSSNLKRLIKQACSMFIVVSIAVGVTSYAFAMPIMDLLYDGADQYWAAIFRVLMFSYLGVCMVYLFSTYLTARRQIRLMNWVFFGGVMLNFTLNFILIRQYGAWGAAIATLVTQSLTAAGLIYIVLRQLSWRPTLKYMAQVVGYGLSLIGLMLLLHQTTIPWLTQAGILCVLALVLGFAIRLVSMRELWLQKR